VAHNLHWFVAPLTASLFYLIVSCLENNSRYACRCVRVLNNESYDFLIRE
jgi:hypothetical protein